MDNTEAIHVLFHVVYEFKKQVAGQWWRFLRGEVKNTTHVLHNNNKTPPDSVN